MAALNFPPSPSTNQIYSANGKSWRFDGTSWKSYYILNVQGGGTGNTFYNLGDILVGAGTSLYPLPVGANNLVLTADNSTQFGITWKATAATGITTLNSLTSTQQYFSVGISGSGFNISSSGSTHTFNIPIAGAATTGLISTLAQTIAGQKTFTSSIIGDLSGTASTATYAHQSGYAITSGFATTANYAHQSGYGITSGFATTASYSYQSGYAITSGFATTAANISVNNATTNLAHPLIFGSTATGSGVAASSNTILSFNPSTSILSVSGLAVTASTSSTSTVTGAITISGGVGIGGSLFLTTSFPSSLSGVVVNNGVITNGSWAGSTITAFYGGTGYNSYTKGDILVGSGTTFIKLNVGTDNYVLTASSLSSTGITWSPTAATGLTTLNGLSVGIQNLAFGYSGTVPGFSSSGSTHTLNIPLAGTGSTGLVSTQAQSFAGIKTFTNAVSITDNTGSGSYTSGALTVTGGVGIGGTLNVQGDLNVQGTFTTINSTTITVADKNIELGVVASPSDLTAEGGGITLRGATNKSINWYSGVGWSSSESFNLGSGNTYKIAGTTVLSNNTLGTGVIFSSIQTAGIITSGTWSATAITALYGGTGLVPSFTVGDILYANTSNTWGRLTASSNSGYVLASSGSGATPTYINPTTLSVGFATTANYAYQSGYAITSGLASTSTYSHQSGYATTSGLATTATYAYQSGYAVTSGFATTASYSYQSGYAITSGFATTAGYAHQAGYAITSGFATTASYAYQSGYGITSGFAATASYSYQSGFAITSGLATTATYANQSGYAITSGFATTATYAYQSGYATTSGFATTAANLNISNASSGIFYPVLSNTASSSSGIGASVNSFFSFNAATGAFGATSVNILSGQSYSIGGNSVLSGTSLGTGVTNSSLTALGTITTGVWAGTSITAYYGGTGYSSYTKGDILVGAGSTFIKLNVGADNFVLTADNTTASGVKWTSVAGLSITSINGLTASAQSFFTGTSGSGFNISSSGSTHTFNIPIAGTGATGLVSTLTQSFAGIKTFTNDVIVSSTTGSTAFNTGALTVYGGLGVSGQLSFNQAALGYTGASNPSMAFIGSTTAAPITLTVLSDNSLLWEGTSGKLFGINNNLSSGWIFNVGDISGLPIIRANADGTIAMAEFAANVGIGLSNPSYKLHVAGDTNLSSTYVYRINGTSVLSSTSLGTGVTNSSLTAVGTIVSGTWSATAITALYGGTGLVPSFTVGDILYANTSSTWGRLAASSNSGYVLTSAGSGATPTYIDPSSLSVGFANTSSYSHQSGYATTSGLATTATYAHQSGYAITAGFATTASYSYQSGYGLTSGFATTATNLNVVASSTNATHYILFSPVNGGSGVAVSSDTGLTFNPASNTISLSTLAATTVNTSTASVSGSTASTSPTTGALVVTGGVGIGGSLFVGGDLTINGTTTTINSVTLTVDDKNIELGSVSSPSDVTAEGGGITLKGATDKFINWYAGTGWSSSESLNLASGNTYKINNTAVLSASSLGTGVTNSSLTALGTITTGVWAGSAITGLYGGTGYSSYTKGDLLVGAGGTFIKLAVGSDNFVLTASSSSATGLTWSPTAATGITSLNGLSSSIQFFAIGYSGTVPSYSSSGSTHTLNIPIAGTGVTGLITGIAQTIAGQKTFTSAIIGDLTGTATTAAFATTANYSLQSGYAITSGFANTSTYAYQSGYAITSGFATTSAYAYQSGYAITSGTASLATTATYAHQSGYGITAGLATTATYAHQSGYSITSGSSGFATTSTYAYQSGYAITSGFATTASYSYQSGYAITSGSSALATTATYAHQSGYAITSGFATTATYSYQSGYGLTSGLATTATYAYQSGYAITSGFATTSANINVANAVTNSAHPLHFSPVATGSGVAVSSNTAISFNPSTLILSSSGLAVTASTVSTSSSTGALVVNGGVGIGGTVFTATDLNVGNSTTGRLYFSQATLGSAGTTVIPTMAFIGTTNSPITLSVLTDNSLSFDGSSGQLFSINNNLSSGWIFAVNDISGLPLLRANADGTVAMGEFAGNVGVGLSNPSYKLHVVGDTNLSSGYVYRINGTQVLSSTSLGTGVTNSSLTAVGTISTGVWAATAITAFYGGTGYNSYTKGDILVGSGSTFIKLGVGADSYVLTASSSSSTGLTWSPTAATGLTTLNGLNAGMQYFATGTSGSGFNISSSGSTHTFNIPIAGIASTGLVSTLAQSFAGIKTFTNDLVVSSSTVSTSTSTGALTVTGGVGIGGSLFTGTSTADSISGVVLNNGVITSGSWAGSTITARYGGTGNTSYTLGDLLVGAGSTFIKLPVGINSYVLGADSTKPSGIGWTTVTPLTVSDTPPASPKNADLWFNSLDGGLLVYYSDVDTNQWVEIALGSGIDLSQPVYITNTTPSTSTSTGALIVDGGIGVAGTVYASSFSINGVYDQISSTLVTSATTANQVALSLDASSFRTAKMVVQVTSGSNYHSQEILMVHDDSQVYMTEYAMVNTGAIGSTFDGDISGGNMRFLVTPTNAVTTYKIACSVMRI